MANDMREEWAVTYTGEYDPCDGTLEFDVVKAGGSHQVDQNWKTQMANDMRETISGP